MIGQNGEREEEGKGKRGVSGIGRFVGGGGREERERTARRRFHGVELAASENGAWAGWPAFRSMWRHGGGERERERAKEKNSATTLLAVCSGTPATA